MDTVRRPPPMRLAVVPAQCRVACIGRAPSSSSSTTVGCRIKRFLHPRPAPNGSRRLLPAHILNRASATPPMPGRYRPPAPCPRASAACTLPTRLSTLPIRQQRFGILWAQQHYAGRQLLNSGDVRPACLPSRATAKLTSGRHVDILKRAGHGILSANGGHAQLPARPEQPSSAETGWPQRLGAAPGAQNIPEGQRAFRRTGGHQLGDGFHHAIRYAP